MLGKFMLALGALVASGWVACAAPLEAYGKLPQIERAEVSPSGKLIAFIATDGDGRALVIQTTQGRQQVFKGPVGALRLRNLVWAGDQHLILTFSTAKQPAFVEGPRVEYSMAEDFDFATGRLRPLIQDPAGVEASLNSVTSTPQVRMIDGKPIVFVTGEHFVSNEGRNGLFRIDLDRHSSRLISKPDDADAYDWLVDEHGEIVAEERYIDGPGRWSLRLRRSSGSWLTVERATWLTSTPGFVGVSSDGKSMLVSFGDEKTGNSWSSVALETGAWGEPTVNPSGEEAILDPRTSRVIGSQALVGDAWRYSFFDPHDAAVWRGVTKAFPGDIVTLESWSTDRRMIAVRVDSAKLGPAFFLVDLSTGYADELGAEYPDLKADDIAPRSAIAYNAADGTEISGYLTLPRGRNPHGLPLVVLPHGGPHARDEPGFDWWSQALASRGYAVLQPNFRGSDGFGWTFLSAGFGEFGRKMQTDLSDGVRYLAAQGVIDPKRVCIVGGSYGGYAALAGAAIDRGVYRCAVSVAGISDLNAMLLDDVSKEGHEGGRFWLRYIGAKGSGDPVLTRYSPASSAAQVTIPVLLIHGRDDTRVPIRQSREMAAALRRAGKPVELIELPAEDHFLSSGVTRLQMLKATVAFLEKNNPADAEPPGKAP